MSKDLLNNNNFFCLLKNCKIEGHYDFHDQTAIMIISPHQNTQCSILEYLKVDVEYLDLTKKNHLKL